MSSEILSHPTFTRFSTRKDRARFSSIVNILPTRECDDDKLEVLPEIERRARALELNVRFGGRRMGRTCHTVGTVFAFRNRTVITARMAQVCKDHGAPLVAIIVTAIPCPRFNFVIQGRCKLGDEFPDKSSVRASEVSKCTGYALFTSVAS
ncbi:hypothetical protein CALVIDRAFT_324396 [Calocera viscosa TUFC12733]|uniref:Uncharacterized protein n=1 Tax=Calocera viscosa (strain TUFC12733) TaxID=1330018 RepID=A0A167QSK0_CALVF|nr:hypothetical protein CALVIDRAFT_324396 [Calocera viscosa TUFC12733]